MNIQKLQELAQTEALKRSVVLCRVEAAGKEYEARLLEGNYEGAEEVRQRIHVLHDVLLDSIASVSVAVRQLNGLK